jgi:hypothetical protein
MRKIREMIQIELKTGIHKFIKSGIPGTLMVDRWLIGDSNYMTGGWDRDYGTDYGQYSRPLL